MDTHDVRPRKRPLVWWVIVCLVCFNVTALFACGLFALVYSPASSDNWSTVGVAIGCLMAMGAALLQDGLVRIAKEKMAMFARCGWNLMGSAVMLASSYALRTVVDTISLNSELGRIASACIWFLAVLAYGLCGVFAMGGVGAFAVLAANLACRRD